jgi:hypothetical protein
LSVNVGDVIPTTCSIISFTANPSTVNYGGFSKLFYSMNQNCRSFFIPELNYASLGVGGYQQIGPLYKTSTYTLKASNDEGCSGTNYSKTTGQACNYVSQTVTVIVENSTTPSITVLSPNGGETFTAGQQIAVKWTSYNVSSSDLLNVSLEYINPSNGSGWSRPLSNNTVNDGVENVYLPDQSFISSSNGIFGKNFKIMVSKPISPVGLEVAHDLSDNLFTITSSTTTPVISGISGPTSLTVNQKGTWTVTAKDSGGGTLLYKVSWGDLDYAPLLTQPTEESNYSGVFSHSYTHAGVVQKPTFTVTNSAGKSAEKSISVNVEAVKSTTPVITGISAPNFLSVNQVGSWKVNAYDPNNGSLTYSVNWDSAPCYPRTTCISQQSSQQSGTFSHSYSQAGVYLITFKVTNSIGESAEKSVGVFIEGSTAISGTSCTDVISGRLGYGPTGIGPFERLGLDISTHPEISKYRIQGYDYAWSQWYVPGQGDQDTKINLDGTSRRMWAYFDDHTHEYINCPPVTTPTPPPDSSTVMTSEPNNVGGVVSKNYDSTQAKYIYSAVAGTKFYMRSQICGSQTCENITPQYSFQGDALQNNGSGSFTFNSSGNGVLTVTYTNPSGKTFQNQLAFKIITTDMVDIVMPTQSWPDKVLWLSTTTLPVKFKVVGASIPDFAYSVSYGDGQYTQPPIFTDSFAWPQGGEYTKNISFSASKCGPHNIKVVLNPDKKILEKDYNNNTFERTIEIDCTTAPYDFDLTIQKNGTWPTTAVQGQSITLNAKYSNIGTQENPKFALLGYGYNGHGPVCLFRTDSTGTHTIQCPAAISSNFSIVDQPVCGNNHYLMKIDAYDDVMETNENNNEITGDVFVDCSKKPDFIIEKVGTWPTTVVSGTKPILNFVEKNIGQATAQAGIVRMTVNGQYRSGAWPSESLSTGSSTSSMLFGYQQFSQPPTDNDWWIPNCKVGDKFTLSICADNACGAGMSLIDESNENNNILTHEVTCTSSAVLGASSDASCGEFTITLSKGMNSSQVKCLQEALNEKGFQVAGTEGGKETIYFGEATLSALKLFQVSKNLVVDGIFGPSSRAALTN